MLTEPGEIAMPVAVWHVEIDDDRIKPGIHGAKERVCFAECCCYTNREFIDEANALNQNLTVDGIGFNNQDRTRCDHDEYSVCTAHNGVVMTGDNGIVTMPSMRAIASFGATQK
jgi:hypothetical protein